jgi:chromosomal replication initiator protein
MELWESVLACIEKRVSHQNFDIWFKPTVLHREDLGQKQLFVQVPNKHFKYWLAENYSEVIQASLSELKLEDFSVSFVADDDSGEGGVSETRLAAALKEPCPDAHLQSFCGGLLQ